ncbi:MAG: septation protein SpoVG family protein [Candidatus Nealsonbacteria bacterium]
MKITEVIVNLVPEEASLIGFASVQLDKVLTIRTIGIHKRKLTYSICMPTRKIYKTGELIPYVSVSPELQEQMRLAVIKRIKEVGYFDFKIKKDNEKK